jgi:hypothetical protein
MVFACLMRGFVASCLRRPGEGATLRARILLGALVALSLSACHTMTIDVANGAKGDVVFERKHFFFWGLAPTKNVDVLEHCPGGAVAIRENTTFVDGLCNFVTLGIWAPRSSWYHCAEAP